MNVGKAIFSILSNNTNVAAMVANDDDTLRIHPLKGYLEEITPFITYQLITGTPQQNKTAADVDAQRVQINVVSDNYDNMKDLAYKVRQALEYQKGTFEGVKVQYISLQSEQDMYEDGAQLNGGSMVVQDYLFRIEL